jgi:hypothetical protein
MKNRFSKFLCNTMEKSIDSYIKLNVYFDKDTFSIRSMLNGNPIYEISGKHNEILVKQIVKSIQEQIVSGPILSLVDNIVLESQKVFPCTIYDMRGENTKTKTTLLMKKQKKKNLNKSKLFKSKSTIIDTKNVLLQF